jgi:hypothetical protein
MARRTGVCAPWPLGHQEAARYGRALPESVGQRTGDLREWDETGMRLVIPGPDRHLAVITS